jgi:hypothetical protein
VGRVLLQYKQSIDELWVFLDHSGHSGQEVAIPQPALDDIFGLQQLSQTFAFAFAH